MTHSEPAPHDAREKVLAEAAEIRQRLEHLLRHSDLLSSDSERLMQRLREIRVTLDAIDASGDAGKQ